MGSVWQRWLADEFRAAGLKVVEVEGWENRGRPAAVGPFDPNGAHTVHHTASTTGPGSRNAPTLGLCIRGRSDLPGPLCQWLTGHDGTVYVIAAGRANHAGPIGKSGVPGMPRGGDGNRYALGNEVDTNGSQDIPPAQAHAIAVAAKVVNDHYGRDEQWTHRHADISGSGKWDIGQYTTNQLRAMVRAATTQEDDMADEKTQKTLAAIQRAAERAAEDAAAAREAAETGVREQRAIRRGTTKNRAETRKVLEAIASGLQVTPAMARTALVELDDEDAAATDVTP